MRKNLCPMMLDALRAFEAVHGMAPSYHNLIDLVDVPLSMVPYYLDKLEAKKMICRNPNKSRSIKILVPGEPTQEMLFKVRHMIIDPRRCRMGVHCRKTTRRTTDCNFPAPVKQSKARLAEIIEQIVQNAKDTNSAGVNIINDFRRGFDPRRSIRATKIG